MSRNLAPLLEFLVLQDHMGACIRLEAPSALGLRSTPPCCSGPATTSRATTWVLYNLDNIYDTGLGDFISVSSASLSSSLGKSAAISTEWQNMDADSHGLHV